MKKLLALLFAGGAAYFAYTTYLKGHPGAGSSAAGRGLSRMRGNSRDLDEVQK